MELGAGSCDEDDAGYQKINGINARRARREGRVDRVVAGGVSARAQISPGVRAPAPQSRLTGEPGTSLWKPGCGNRRRGTMI